MNFAHSTSADGRANSDTFDATVDEINSVVRRDPDAHWRYDGVANPRYHILAFAAEGRAHYRCRGREFPVQSGQLLFFFRGTAHHGRSDPVRPWTFYSTTFSMRPVNGTSQSQRELERMLGELPVLIQLPNHREAQAMFRQLHYLWVERQPAYLMHCRAIIQQVMAMIVDAVHGCLPNVPHAHRIAAIMQLLQRQGHDQAHRRYSVEELADMAGLSPSRFRVLFQQVAGMSVVRYQNMLRINRAKDLLLSGNCTVTEAAELSGFRDVYYFSRLFKKMTGLTPSSLRQR